MRTKRVVVANTAIDPAVRLTLRSPVEAPAHTGAAGYRRRSRSRSRSQDFC
jgi:hypothetical protein